MKAELIKELLESVKYLMSEKGAMLSHFDFCREGLSDEYEHLFDHLEYSAKKVQDDINQKGQP